MVVGAESHLGTSAGAGVLERVGQRLLDDAVRGQVHAGWKVRRNTISRQRDIQTRPCELIDEPRDIGDARLGTEPANLGSWSQDAQQVAQLIECFAAGLFYCLHRLHRPLRVIARHGPGGAGLHRHHAHPMGDDVVQLTRDPGSLLGHHLAGLRRPLSFALCRALVTDLDAPADVPHQQHHEQPEPDLRCGHRVEERGGSDQRERASEPEVAPPLVGDVAADAVEGHDHGDPDVPRVAKSQHQGGCAQGHRKHAQRMRPPPVEGGAGHGVDDQGSERHVPELADGKGLIGSLERHEDDRQEDDDREGGVRGPRPARDRARRGPPNPSAR